MGNSHNLKPAIITASLILVYSLILGSNLCWNVLLLVFAKDMCTGTGMGANNGTVMCQDYTDLAPLLLFALNLLLFAGAVHVIRTRHLGWLSSGAVIACTIAVVFGLPMMVWSFALSTLPVK